MERSRLERGCGGSTAARQPAAGEQVGAESTALPVYAYLHICMADGGKEFSVLNEDANIYKLIGPVLVKQDRAEAVMNVDKRLEFIEAEMYAHLPSLAVSSDPLTRV